MKQECEGGQGAGAREIRGQERAGSGIFNCLPCIDVFSSAGNALTCLIKCRKPSFRTASNISISFLPVSHILAGILIMPLSLVFLIKRE